jgi:hypothetical protein
MGDEDTKQKHSQKRRRNFLAKRLRTEREFLPKIHDPNPRVNKLPKINPRTVELEYPEYED